MTTHTTAHESAARTRALRLFLSLIFAIAGSASDVAAQTDCIAPDASISAAPILVQSCSGRFEVHLGGVDQVRGIDCGVTLFLDGMGFGFAGAGTGGSTGLAGALVYQGSNQISTTHYEDHFSVAPPGALPGETVDVTQSVRTSGAADRFEISWSITNNTSLAFAEIALILAGDLAVMGDAAGDCGAEDWAATRTVTLRDDLPAPALHVGFSAAPAIGDAAIGSASFQTGSVAALWNAVRSGSLIDNLEPSASDQALALGFRSAYSLAPGQSWQAQGLWTFALPPAVPPAPLLVDTICLPCGIRDYPYTTQLSACGGRPAAWPNPPYSWSALTTLPAGLTLDPQTGVLSGLLGEAGPITFTVRVTDFDTPAATSDTTLVLDGGCAPTCPEHACGDCDDNGFTDIGDALMAVRIASGLAGELSPTSFNHCNVYGDGSPNPLAAITVLDGLWIAQASVGLRALECCQPQLFMRTLAPDQIYCDRIETGGAPMDLGDLASTHFFQIPFMPANARALIEVRGAGDLELWVGEPGAAIGSIAAGDYAWIDTAPGANKSLPIDATTMPDIAAYWGTPLVIAVHARTSAEFQVSITSICDPIDLTVTGSAFGDTSIGENQSGGTCGGLGSAELAYRYEVASVGYDLTISLDHPATTFDSILRVQSACEGAAVEIACDDNSGSGATSLIILPAAAPGVYFIIVDGNGAGPFQITCTESPSLACAGALEGAIPDAGPWPHLIVGNLTLADDTSSSTCATGSIDHGYSFTPAATGAYDFSLCGATSMDSVLFIRRDDCTTGAIVACNDDLCALQSHLDAVMLFAGVQYFVFVETFTGMGAAYTLTVQPTPAAVCGTCAGTVDGVLTGMSLPILQSGTTVGADNTFQQLPCGGGGGADRVFEFKPSATGTYTISLCTSAYSTILGIRECNCDLTAPGALAIGCNVGGCGTRSRLIGVPLNATKTYYIFVDGVSGATGAYTLQISTP